MSEDEKKESSNDSKVSTEKKEEESNEDLQFYLITLEDNNGNFHQIKIFKNSDAEEIAFNFCKENNLDFKSMKFIKKNIKKIIKKFDDTKQKIVFLDGSNSSIQEVDEENFITEGTLKSDLIDSESKETHIKKATITKKQKKDLNSELSLTIQENINEEHTSSQNEEKNTDKIISKDEGSQY